MAWRTGGLAAALLLAGLGAGCATTAPPGAVTAYARQDCAPRPDLAKAISLTPDKPKPAFIVTTPVNAATACLARAGGASPYVLYALPADLEGKTLTVGGLLESARTLAPDVALLGPNGEPTRSFAAGDFLFRGALYSVQFLPKPGEAYVLVAIDPVQVGKRFDSIEIGTNTTTVSTGVVTSTWTAGVDRKVARTFSYEGQVQVTVFDGKARAGR